MVGDERDDVGFVVDDEDALAGDGGWTGRSRRGASRRPARAVAESSATIISMATALWPPRGTITSAYRFDRLDELQCIG